MSQNATKPMQDGREIAVSRQLDMLRLLHRFGWLRTSDLACATAKASSKPNPRVGPSLRQAECSRADIRRTQRHLAALRERKLILSSEAPNGSIIYALSEKGARILQGIGLSATTGKDLLRNYHAAYFLHRNISNELAIGAMQEGYRISSEREIAQGRWLGGLDGILGKKPDVVIGSGNESWFCEVERSHRNSTDYEILKNFLLKIWDGVRVGASAPLAERNLLRQVIFICTPGFQKKLSQELFLKKWSPDELKVRIRFETSLYSFKSIAFY